MPPAKAIRFSDLSRARAALVRECQSLNFGVIEDVEVLGTDPVLGAATKVLLDLKLDSDEGCRPEVTLEDFVLPQEWVRLIAYLDELRDCLLRRVEVRGGLPRRILIERVRRDEASKRPTVQSSPQGVWFLST